jgi:hypothetical protein
MSKRGEFQVNQEAPGQKQFKKNRLNPQKRMIKNLREPDDLY